MRTVLACLLVAACGKSSSPPPAPTPASGSAPIADAAVGADAAVVDAAIALVDAGGPDAAKTECTAAAIGQARKAADAHVKAGRYAEAIALLENDSCWLQMDQPAPLQTQIAWALSDLSFAYYKAGRFNDCYGIASAQVTPYTGNVGAFFDEGSPVIRALEHNAKLCQEAAAKERGPFTDAAPCPFDENAVAIPDSGGACLVIAEGKRGDDELLECGAVSIVKKKPKSRTVLEVEQGNLVSSSVCCTAEVAGFGKRAGATWTVLVMSQGRDCNGGTAASEEQHAYALVGNKLELFHTLNASAH